MCELLAVVAVVVVIAVVTCRCGGRNDKRSRSCLSDDVKCGPRTRSGLGAWTARARQGDLRDVMRTGARARVRKFALQHTEVDKQRIWRNPDMSRGICRPPLPWLCGTPGCKPCAAGYSTLSKRRAHGAAAPMAPTPMGSQRRQGKSSKKMGCKQKTHRVHHRVHGRELLAERLVGHCCGCVGRGLRLCALLALRNPHLGQGSRSRYNFGTLTSLLYP